MLLELCGEVGTILTQRNHTIWGQYTGTDDPIGCYQCENPTGI